MIDIKQKKADRTNKNLSVLWALLCISKSHKNNIIFLLYYYLQVIICRVANLFQAVLVVHK